MNKHTDLSASQRVKITLIRSASGRIPKHTKTLESMGLRRIGQSVSLPNNPATLGMINSVNYLVKAERE